MYSLRHKNIQKELSTNIAYIHSVHINIHMHVHVHLSVVFIMAHLRYYLSAKNEIKLLYIIKALRTCAKTHPTSQSMSLLWLHITSACSLPEKVHHKTVNKLLGRSLDREKSSSLIMLTNSKNRSIA